MESDGRIEVELGVPIPGKILPVEQWARTAIKKLPPPGPLDWTALFGRTAPIVLDLGCGNGRFIVSSAVRRPTHDHLGLDILPLVVRYATRRANQRGLTNVRIAVCGAFEFLEQYVSAHSIGEIHVYHPQPYHEESRAHQRLITPEFLALVWRSLQPDGKFVIQTDDTSYWRYIQLVAPKLFDLVPRDGPWPEDPSGRTRREIIARRQGLTIYRAECRPRTDRTDAELAELVTNLPRPAFSTDRSIVRRSGGGPRRARRTRHRR